MQLSPQAYQELCQMVLNATLEMSTLERAPTEMEGLGLFAMRALVALGVVPLDDVVERGARLIPGADVELLLTVRNNMKALFSQPAVLERVGVTFPTVH